MERPAPLPVHMAVANLEHRLTLLHQRQESLLHQSEVLKRAVWIALPAVGIIVVCLALTTQSDPRPMLFFFFVVLAALAVVAWMYRHTTWSIEGGRADVFPFANRYTSHRVFLEESIKECEEELAELKAQYDNSA